MGLDLDLIREKRKQAKEEAAKRNANYYSWKDGRSQRPPAKPEA